MEGGRAACAPLAGALLLMVAPAAPTAPGPPPARPEPSLLRRVWGDRLATFFHSVTNVLGRENVAAVRWDRDCSERILVPSSFGRTVFLGVTTELPLWAGAANASNRLEPPRGTAASGRRATRPDPTRDRCFSTPRPRRRR